MWLDGKRNGLRRRARLLVRNLIEDMQGYALKVMTRKLHRCIIAFLFQLYLINSLKYALVSQCQFCQHFSRLAFMLELIGSHFAVGGMDRIMIPLHASSDIREVLRLSTAALQVRSNLM